MGPSSGTHYASVDWIHGKEASYCVNRRPPPAPAEPAAVGKRVPRPYRRGCHEYTLGSGGHGTPRICIGRTEQGYSREDVLKISSLLFSSMVLLDCEYCRIMASVTGAAIPRLKIGESKNRKQRLIGLS